MKEKILDFLLASYKKSKWPFTNVSLLQQVFGQVETKQALNELWKEGYIQRRDSVNTPMVELIKFEK